MTSQATLRPILTKVLGAIPRSRKGRIDVATVALAVVLTLAIGLVVPDFLRVRNLFNIVNQLSVLGFMAIGMTYVMVAGGIDLSMYTVVSAASVVGATIMAAGYPPALGCLTMIVVSMGFGLVNGIAIAVGKMTPFIVTLSTTVLAQGFAAWFTSAQSVSDLPDSYVDTISGRLWGVVPVPAVIVIGTAVVAGVTLARTKYGRWVYLTGDNERTARISGLPTRLVKVSTYIFSGLMAGITAVVLTAMIGTATTAMLRDDSLLDVIATTVIGGASLAGGSGSVLGTMLGLVFITALGNVFNLVGVSPFMAMVLKGLVLVTIVGLDALRSRR